MSGKGGIICAVYGCSNYKLQKDSRSFFRFPKDNDLCHQWVLKCKREDLDEIFKHEGSKRLYDNYRVCDAHFKNEDFRNPNLKSQGLKKGIVFSLNLYGSTSTSLRNSPKKRKRETPSLSVAGSSQNVTEEENHNVRKASTVQVKRCKLHSAQKKISKLKSEVLKLRKSNLQLKTANRFYRKQILGTESEFLLNQCRLRRYKRKGRRYSEYDKNFALALHYCSSSAYRFLEKTLCLPSVRSIRRWLEKVNLKGGLNENIFAMLTLKSSMMSLADRVVSIILDGMSLKEAIMYNACSDHFEGIPDMPINVEKVVFANEALVMMIKGLKLNFKQVIGYFLSRGAMPGSQIKDILLSAINKLKGAGFTPKVVVCDQGSNFRKMRTLLHISTTKPYCEIDGEKIFFMYDVPHLLKSVRNNLKKYNFKIDDKICKWEHIQSFYEKDKVRSPRLASKLKDIHITLPPFSPMRVCLAAQVMSQTVGNGILTLVALNLMESEAIHTAEFLHDIDDLFDCFNSSSLSSPKVYKRALKKNSWHWKHLLKMANLLGKIQIMKQNNAITPCIEGWLGNIAALKLLFEDLSVNYNFEYLLTRRLTQDCIENLFSIIRYKGGNNVTPDATKFRLALRSIMVNQMLSPSDDGNCQMDFDSFLLKKKDLESSKYKIDFNEDTIKQNETIDDYANIVDDPHTANSITYVTGWACSKLLHEECISKLTSPSESFCR